MNKEDIKVGLIFRMVSMSGFYHDNEYVSDKTYSPYLYKITELTVKGFKYELAEKEKYPNSIGGIPRLGISFMGDGECFINGENEYMLAFYEIAELEYDI